MRLDMLWMGRKSIDQQVEDRGNGLQSTKTRDTGNEGQLLLATRIMTHCTVNA
jgi:hypothetical protein